MKRLLPLSLVLLLLMSPPAVAGQAIAPAAAQSNAAPVVLEDLKSNLEFIFPQDDYLSGLKYHTEWREVTRKLLSEAPGVEVTYEAVFDAIPVNRDELPTINAYLIPKPTRDAAEDQFNLWSRSPNFSNGTWTKVSEGKGYFSYLTRSSHFNDLVKYRPLEEASLHLVRYYDNVLMVVNFYRTSGDYYKNNVDAYLSYMADSESTLGVMNELVVFTEEALTFYLGSVFSVKAPAAFDFNPSSRAFSDEVTAKTPLPLNGTISFDLLLNDASEVGTVFSMSTSPAPQPGTLKLALNEDATLELSFYEDRLRSACESDNGWHRIKTSAPLALYEWQTVTLGYGWAESLSLSVNGETQAVCDVNTPRAGASVYLGDAPGDAVQESFVGYLKALTPQFSVVEGVRLDDLEGRLIFTDVSEAHPNAVAIQYIKDKGVMGGYANGTFRPFQAINRAEILKTLLTGFDYKITAGSKKLPFSDVAMTDWYLPYVQTAVSLGVVKGNPDGTFSPGNPINRAEFLKMMLLAYGAPLNDYPITELYADVPRDAWFAPYVQYAKNNNLMAPDKAGRFNPSASVTRAEVAETLYRLLTRS